MVTRTAVCLYALSDNGITIQDAPIPFLGEINGHLGVALGLVINLVESVAANKIIQLFTHEKTDGTASCVASV